MKGKNVKRINISSGKLDDILIHGFNLIMDNPHVRVFEMRGRDGKVERDVNVCLGEPSNEEYKDLKDIIFGISSFYSMTKLDLRYVGNKIWKDQVINIVDNMKDMFKKIVSMLEDKNILVSYDYIEGVIKEFEKIKEKYSKATGYISTRNLASDLMKVTYKAFETKIWYKDDIMTIREFVTGIIRNGIKEVISKACKDKTIITGYNGGIATVKKVHPYFFKRWYKIEVTTRDGEKYNIYVKV